MVHIGELRPDARNARRHTERNLSMLARALQEVGAARSIVIDEDGNILAGNATVEAAAAVGIENVRVVEADGNTLVAVRRSGLSDEQKKRLALYDNRVAELAGWDEEVLAELALDDGMLDGLFTDDELAALLKEVELPEPGSGKAEDVPELWAIVVDCDGEEQQIELLQRFTEEGLRCRALIS